MANTVLSTPTSTPQSREIFGAEIQYFRLDPRYWETILQRFVDTGLRCVTTYVQWSTHLVGAPDAQHPAGVLDFTGQTHPQRNLLRFLDLVQKYNLNLNFRCGPFCCNEMIHGGYPEWLVLGDPNMMVWDYQNRTTQGYWIGKKEGSQPSYLHPTYLDWCRKWMREVDAIIHPRLKSNGGFITMINLDNEISYIVKDSFLDSDYNPCNVAPGGFYHQFLKEKYASPEKLSDAYGKAFKNITDVLAPRAVPASVGRDLAWYADWVEFKTWAMCRYIRELRAMHESNGVKDVTFMTNFNPHLPEGVPTRMPEFEKAVGENGLVGYDFYRGAFMSYSGYHSMARVLKLMNASLRYTWSAEFMSGLWNLDMSKTSRISDDHMRFMARCALAHGCKAIDWFMFHDRDCWGDTPVSGHGHVRPSHAVLKETPHLLFGKIKNWDALVPQGEVAVVYDLIHHVHTAIGDPQPCNDNANHVGAPTLEAIEAGKASKEYYGLFRLAEQAGYQAHAVDIVQAPARLKNYPLVLFPGSPVTASATSEALAAYVKSGGILLVSGPWPTVNEIGKPLSFLGLSAPQAAGLQTWPLGEGKVLWHPTLLAQEEAEHESLQNVELLASLIGQHAGPAHVHIRPAKPVTWTSWKEGGGHAPKTEPRNLGSAVLHRSEKESVLFVLNHYPVAAEFELTFGRDRVRQLQDLDSGDIIDSANGVFAVDVDRKAGRIFHVRYV